MFLLFLFSARSVSFKTAFVFLRIFEFYSNITQSKSLVVSKTNCFKIPRFLHKLGPNAQLVWTPPPKPFHFCKQMHDGCKKKKVTEPLAEVNNNRTSIGQVFPRYVFFFVVFNSSRGGILASASCIQLFAHLQGALELSLPWGGS